VQSEILEVIGDRYRPPAEGESSANVKTTQEEEEEEEEEDISGDATDATTLARIQKMSNETAAKAMKRARSSVQIR
jgi:hypothetical protein